MKRYNQIGTKFMFQRILETLDHVLVQLLQKSKNILTMMKRYGIISRMKIDFKMADLKTIKKVTPKGDLSWYIKWTSSYIILISWFFQNLMAIIIHWVTPYDSKSLLMELMSLRSRSLILTRPSRNRSITLSIFEILDVGIDLMAASPLILPSMPIHADRICL